MFINVTIIEQTSAEKKSFLQKYYYHYEMDDLEEEERGIDDLIFPRKKTLTDLWREEWEREFNLYERGNRV